MTPPITIDVSGPHSGAEVLTAGAPLESARAAVILLHGRGGLASEILTLHELIDATRVSFLAPQAPMGTWYPFRFLEPLARNEPHLSSALGLVGALVKEIESRGVPPDRQVLLGFSQGGCLVLEWAGRNARRFGGIAGLSGGLVGPPGRAWDFDGSLDGTPVLLGCSDRDPHIPLDRVRESATELTRIGAQVDLRIYPGLGHTINEDEMARVAQMVKALPV